MKTLLIFILATFLLNSQNKINDRINALYPKYIYKGFVAYGKWNKSQKDLEELRSIFEEMQRVDINSLKNDTKKAFYVNLYNIAVLNLVMDNFPTSSIMKIENAFEKRFIDVNNKKVSLNDLEKRILLKEFPDPRTHFALVCAALSCPYLRKFAYDGNELEKQLEFVTKEFLLDKKMNQFTEKEASISKLFDWYLSDFGTKANMISFINRYIDIKITENTKINYLEYSWKLNGELSLRSAK